MTQHTSEQEWEKDVRGQVRLIVENAVGVERGESIDMREPLENGMVSKVESLLSSQHTKDAEEWVGMIADNVNDLEAHDLLRCARSKGLL